MKRVSKILMLLCAFIFLISGVGTVIYSAVKDSDDNFGDNFEEFVSVQATTIPEIFSGSTLNSEPMKQLLSAISGIPNNTSIALLDEKIPNGGIISAADIRKLAGSDVKVSLGGFNWECVCVSKDNNNNTILTLWLDSCVQSSFPTSSTAAGSYYGYYNHGLYSDWSSDWAGRYTINYPSAVYGASYIRCVTLNNGGTYFEPSSNPHNPDAGSSSTRSASQTSGSAFARFTMPSVSNALTDYIVKPTAVSWQRVQPSPSTAYGNESWDVNANTGSYSKGGAGSFYEKVLQGRSDLWSYYSAWKDDYIWLPSHFEVGTDSSSGYWQLSQDQLTNIVGSADYISVKIGNTSLNISGNQDRVYTFSWTRSANNVSGSGDLEPSLAHRLTWCVHNTGAGSGTSWDTRCSLAVRPAFHFNLTAACARVFNNESCVTVSELFDTKGENTNPASMRLLLEYLTGKQFATLDDLTASITDEEPIYTSEDIRNIMVTPSAKGETAKPKGVNVRVYVGGLLWECCSVSIDKQGDVVLTLWLAGNSGFKDPNNPSNAPTLKSEAGDYYGFYNGGLYSDWSSDWAGPFSLADPSSVYSTSYIRAVTLNNGGDYAIAGNNANSPFVTSSARSGSIGKDSNHVFARFTVEDHTNSLTKYIVKPSEIAWQENEKSLNYDATKIAYGNEAWSSTYAKSLKYYSGATSGFDSYLNRASNDYERWKNDYIWLPSYTEIGASGGGGSGIWMLNEYQRRNGNVDKEIASTNAKVGGSFNFSGDPGVLYNHSWTRSAGYSFDPAGDTTGYRFIWLASALGGSGSYMWDSRCTMAVRPAFHLNLSQTFLSAFGSIEEAEIRIMKDVVAEESQIAIYDGYSRTVEVYIKGHQIAKNEDYTIWVNNVQGDVINPDVGVSTIRIRGINGYTGEKESWFAIAPYEISDEADCRVTVGQPPDQPETGQQIRPVIDVSDNLPSSGPKTLVLNTDYTVNYTDNINVGTARMTVKGIGNYVGAVERTFSIGPAAKYDKEGGYWYIEIGEAPQTRVSDTYQSTLKGLAVEDGNKYSIQSSVNGQDNDNSLLKGYSYDGVKYAVYANKYYIVEPIKWRITGWHNSGDLLSGLNAVCTTIVFLSQYSEGPLAENPSYSSYAADEFMNNVLKEDETGTSFMNQFVPQASKLAAGKLFVASGLEIKDTAGSFEVKFSDLIYDVLRNSKSEAVYFTRDNGTDVNNMITYNMYGNKTNHYANELYGVQFVINISRLICGTII